MWRIRGGSGVGPQMGGLEGHKFEEIWRGSGGGSGGPHRVFFWPETSSLCAPEASETFGSNLWPSRGGGSGAAHQGGGLVRRTRGRGHGTHHHMGGGVSGALHQMGGL